MPRPFLEFTLEQFESIVDHFPWRRRITEVHVHHTFRPNHADFATKPPVQSIEGMFRFHTEERGFSDIAQHITIDPQGSIWTGRDWNSAPASATGFNGNATAGPFMFEMIGNFDNGHDTWTGLQRSTAIRVIAKVQAFFGLPPSAFRFHNEMSSKTCPGSAIRRADVLEAVSGTHNQLAAERGAGTEASRATSAERATVDRMLRLFDVRARGVGAAQGETELPERDMTLRQAEMSAGSSQAFDTSRAGDTAPLTPEDFALLRRHVINLRMGALSSGGTFGTTKEDVLALFAEHLPRFLDERRQEAMPLKLVFFAHGGLNDEIGSLRNARNRIPFYLANRCYPVFFVWETGVTETLVDIVRQLAGFSPGRGVGEAISNVSDSLLEGMFRPAGFSMWLNMKRSAELAFMPKQGGTFLVEELAAFWKQHSAEMEIHAIGHSAGAIFQAQLVNALCQQPSNPPIEIRTLQYLAPAITIDLFKDLVADLVGNRVKALTEYTMKRDFEAADSVGPYRKSLLYLVSRSFEDLSEMPLLGLEESLRRDPDMTRFFGLLGAGQKRRADVLFSKSENGPRHSTIAIKHGDFDNDRHTMSGVIRRILDVQDAEPIIEFPETVSKTVLDEARSVAIANPAVVAPVAASNVMPAPAAPVMLAASSGRRKALCVGIDDYNPPDRLAGCVNDAKDWAAVLSSLGFDVAMMLDREATWQNLQDALGNLITSARAGDVVVFQYAGHGTRVNDLDGDEESGRDSALCPVDFTGGRLLIDDDVRRIVQRLADGVNFTCFFDCCHSGTITRFVAPSPTTPRGDVRTRGLRATPEVEAAHAAFRRSMPGAAPAGRGLHDMKEISFTACNDAQTAQEIDGHGQFTLRALNLLRQGVSGITNRDFHERVTAAFGNMAQTQTPGLDCAPRSMTLPLFGGFAAVTEGTSDLRNIVARLDALERRVARAGV
jgi:caspase domain-containing protein